MAEKYQRVNDAWGMPPHQLPAPTEQEAIAAMRRLYRLAMGKAFDGDWVITSGNRFTWPARNRKTSRREFRVNAGAGWWRMVHDLSHYISRRKHPKAKPHGPQHAFIERELIEHVVKSGWLAGALRKPEKPKPDRKAAAQDRIEARLANWQRKLTRAQRAIARLSRKQRYYQRQQAAAVAS